jgi:hypothetical protein
MSELIMAMSGDFDSEFQDYQDIKPNNMESAALTIVECGTENCTVILC